MSDEPPKIYQPIPRRPFELGPPGSTTPEATSPSLSATTLYDDDEYSNPTSSTFLDPTSFQLLGESISRDQSYQALTSSTLSGIYSPVMDGYPTSPTEEIIEDDLIAPRVRRGTMDDEIYKLVRGRQNSLLTRRRPSALSARSGQGVQPASSLSLGFRTGLLFALGMGYGALLSRLSTEQKWASFPVEGIMKPSYSGKYLAAWGICGVFLGSLLPWFDGKWEEMVEKGDVIEEEDEEDEDEVIVDDDEGPGTDWALVIRGIGAFAGIVFAIRKVPWASTMQVSITLAAVNPFLWYLIDRSKPGFLLSAAVGLAGSIVALGLNQEIMPAPIGYSSQDLHRNHTGQTGGEPTVLGGLATERTIETGIWVLSVLFCSCVCFGNIGRRLALNKSAVGRGRWGGLR